MFSLLSKTSFMDIILKVSMWENKRGHSSSKLAETLLSSSAYTHVYEFS